MKKRYLNIIVILLFIGATVSSSYFVLDLSASAKNSHLITLTHEVDLIAGNSVCFQDNLQNNKNRAVTINVAHTGEPDLVGINIILYQAIPNNGGYTRGGEIDFPITLQAHETFHFYICYYTNIALKPDTYTLETRFIMENGDDEPPTVEITKPLEKSLYIGNHRICSWWFTMVIGGIDIEVDASDDAGGSGMDRVEFYIDSSLIHTVNSPPYVWTWDEFTFGSHEVKVMAFDNAGNSASDKITVCKFF